ncbi:hypothetical protein KBB96_10175 [Luteolibacter ambystomatis]|uniref:Uncharacterized protein n=1 Tax=Luteolibacter ambystomatis TaxID=2824561 RepID=A0A975PGZ6_9BACT|nr:hypothetical protein [Luteolibacter ambystomatis]QUE53244.1 hypothetical protein KBB96_10175 [Luteolibacter ambystomatis]
MSAESFATIEHIRDGTTFTLIVPGEFFASVPKIDAEQDLFEADGFLAGESFFEPLGGATARITFAVEKDFDDYDDALLAFQSAGNDLMADTGILRITIKEDLTQWTGAVLASVTPGLSSEYGIAVVSTEFEFLMPPPPDAEIPV